MTFLTEMGDLNRFDNRRQVAAYSGLCPSSNESGEKNDRKGRITRQARKNALRKPLGCQSIVAHEAAADYHRIKQNQKHRSKKALVAMMRKLGIKMPHGRCLAVCGAARSRPPRPKDFAQASDKSLCGA